MGQRFGLPEGGIIAGDHHWEIVTEESGRWMVPSVRDQTQHLVGNGVDFDGDAPRLHLFKGFRSFRQGVSMTDSGGSQEDRVNL